MHPSISVLVPVYNARPFLREALESLNRQTLQDFEVVAVDDGSTDGSKEILLDAARCYRWLRIINQGKEGLVTTLNRTVAESRGEFLARMDADDVAAPERLERQLAFMRREPSIGVCGSFFRTMGKIPKRVIRVPVDDGEIRARLIFGSPFAHPAVMMRREVLVGLNGPYDSMDGAEDYGLWLRLAQKTKLHNLPEILQNYRLHKSQFTAQSDLSRRAKITQQRLTHLHSLGIEASRLQARLHEIIAVEACESDPNKWCEVEDWLEYLSRRLAAVGWCSEKLFFEEGRAAWWRYSRRQGSSWSAISRFRRSRWAGTDYLSWVRRLRLAVGR